jgi:hypothetical protein
MRTNGYFEFLTYFVDLEDPRADRGNNHSLIDMVGLVLCGTICGADTSGGLHAKSFAEQDFREVCIIPGCIEPLVLDTNLGC